ncbi:MAG TPA: Spy/CpxP family protein refolding chaperone [Caulobacteraceae bacterium]
MKSPLTRAALIAGAALSVTFAGATYAQAPQGAPAQQMKRQHDPAAMAQRLRTTLQLTPAQEPALQAFMAAHQERREDRADRKAEHEAMRNLTTPQRLDRMAAMMAQHQREFAEHAAAVKRFYAQLTPAQQKAFDAMHDGMGRHGGKHRGMGGGRHHEGGPGAPQG